MLTLGLPMITASHASVRLPATASSTWYHAFRVTDGCQSRPSTLRTSEFNRVSIVQTRDPPVSARTSGLLCFPPRERRRPWTNNRAPVLLDQPVAASVIAVRVAE